MTGQQFILTVETVPKSQPLCQVRCHLVKKDSALYPIYHRAHWREITLDRRMPMGILYTDYPPDGV